MRIALVSRFAWPRRGGTEELIRTGANALAASNEVQVFAQRTDTGGVGWLGPLDRAAPFAPVTDPLSGVRTTQLRLTRGDIALLAPYVIGPKRVGSRIRPMHHVSWALEQLYAAVVSRRFAPALARAEVIHAFAGSRMTLATVRAARRLGRPVVVTPLAHPGQWDDDPISATAYREADLVVATTPADAETYTRLGVTSDRLGVCPLPTRTPARGGGARLREAGIVTGPLILFLGVRRPHKGVDSLLGAAAILREAAPRAQVAFVGPGPPLPDSAPSNVLDVGEVGDEQRDAWLDVADIVCLPSSHESWGLAVSEAWSAGVPVVTSDLPILRGRVDEAGGGIAVAAEPGPLAEALLTLLRDDALRERMGRSGHEHYAKELSDTAFAAWHEQAYRRLLGR
jgi:glycosyltransferase involved in cell wall biosynthesis